MITWLFVVGCCLWVSSTTQPADNPYFLPIPAGRYLQGGVGENEDEKPRHCTDIRAFRLGKGEVTNAQYARFLQAQTHTLRVDTAQGTVYQGETAILSLRCVEALASCQQYAQKIHYEATTHTFSVAADYAQHPALLVTWYGASAYCAWLTTLLERPCWLPTEAEWEYAARAGESTAYAGGPAIEALGWCALNSLGRPQPTYQKQPNAWGLYDLSGNAAEWCQDWYQADYYRSLVAGSTNPTGPSVGHTKVVRGGSWADTPQGATLTYRGDARPGYASLRIGFRVATRW